RRPPVAEQPETKMPEDPPRPKIPRVTFEPPSPAASAVEQLVGLEKEASVDLSSNKPPDYPQEAIRKRWEGVVLLRLTVDRSGAVTRVDLLESSGHPLLDETAIQAVSTWKGTPAKRWGRAVESTEQLPIRFRL
ncbi:MAG: energy transducer TonB, partial [Planctomycetota bacterium]